MTLRAVRELAYELAERNNLQHRFSRERKSAGKSWMHAFLQRHPELTLRSPEPTSALRARGFNKPATTKFFNILQQVYNEHNMDSTRIFNCDESSMKTVQKVSKILAKRDQHQVGSLTSAERGKNVTVVFAMSAAGRFVPPFFIFGRKRMNSALMDSARAGSVATCQPKGWMNGEIFKDYLLHFIKTVGASKDKPIALILDGHSSHTQSMEVLELATQHGITMVSLPPHTTH